MWRRGALDYDSVVVDGCVRSNGRRGSDHHFALGREGSASVMVCLRPVVAGYVDEITTKEAAVALMRPILDPPL